MWGPDGGRQDHAAGSQKLWLSGTIPAGTGIYVYNVVLYQYPFYLYAGSAASQGGFRRKAGLWDAGDFSWLSEEPLLSGTRGSRGEEACSDADEVYPAIYLVL